MLEASERFDLLVIADQSIARGLDGRSKPLPERNWSPRLLEPCATFTTLMIGEELRGCCGTIEAQRPLVEDVWRTAWTSAYADPRFWPVTSDEIRLLEITISVLTPLEALPARTDAELIACLEPGVHGVVLRHGMRCATFLPSVWKSLPDPYEFLEQLKRKASWSYPAAAWPAETSALRYCTEIICSRRTSEGPRSPLERAANDIAL